jgi:thioredoxin-like negative regulator of GroEL
MSAKPNTPQPSTPSGSAAPDLAQMERVLKAQLDQADKNPRDVLWQLARLYQATKRPDQALQCLRRILASESDLEVGSLKRLMQSLAHIPALLSKGLARLCRPPQSWVSAAKR